MNEAPKLAIIGTVGVPARYGGFETLAHQLVLHLNKDFQITVYASKPHYPKEARVAEWEGARVVYLPLRANGWQSIFYDMLSMLHALFFADVMLVLGVSGCLLLPFIKLFPWVRVVVNVDGLEWRRAKWNGWAKKMLILSERFAVWFADEIITDNAAIQDYVGQHYARSSALIEYGGDQAKAVPVTEEARKRYPFLGGRYAFKVCRIEPENNIHVVLEAFSRQRELPLVLVGNWNHSDYGRKLRQAYGQYEHLYLLDPIFDPVELNTLRSNCWLYVHGHSAGGTNPSLVEAMCLARPIVAFDVVYNRVTTEGKALYFKDADDLATVLQTVTDNALTAIGEELFAVAMRRYRWAHIAARYAEVMAEGLAVPVLDTEQPAHLANAA